MWKLLEMKVGKLLERGAAVRAGGKNYNVELRVSRAAWSGSLEKDTAWKSCWVISGGHTGKNVQGNLCGAVETKQFCMKDRSSRKEAGKESSPCTDYSSSNHKGNFSFILVDIWRSSCSRLDTSILMSSSWNEIITIHQPPLISLLTSVYTYEYV